jgi:class 3 adenylate cyclase
LGDGLLAIFPVGDHPAAACEAALAAVAETRARLTGAHADHAANGRPARRHGSALHMGEVLCGNVGSATRLDFTTIGPAVNLSARLETLARDLGREVVLSSAVAACLPDAVTSLGRFELRGFREPQDPSRESSSRGAADTPHGLRAIRLTLQATLVQSPSGMEPTRSRRRWNPYFGQMPEVRGSSIPLSP